MVGTKPAETVYSCDFNISDDDQGAVGVRFTMMVWKAISSDHPHRAPYLRLPAQLMTTNLNCSLAISAAPDCLLSHCKERLLPRGCPSCPQHFGRTAPCAERYLSRRHKWCLRDSESEP